MKEEVENSGTENVGGLAADFVGQSDVKSQNLGYARKLIRLAWGIELILVSVGLGIAFAQASSMPEGSGFAQTFPVFGVFVVLAAVELAKIPAATVVFHSRRWARLFASVGLLVAALISFETIFNGFERFVHVTTTPVAEAKAELREINGEIKALSEAALQDELDGTKIKEADAEQLESLRTSLALREEALQRAKQSLESLETRELRSQLERVIQQQTEAGDAAADAWQSEQDSIMSRLNGSAIDQQTRAQLNARMRSMPAKQTVISEARAPFDAEVQKLNTEIEASITEPDPQALAALNDAQTARNQAAERLSEYEAESAVRAAERVEALAKTQMHAAERGAKIEVLEEKAVTKSADVEELSNQSQMHRWASFVFAVEPYEVSEDQAKQIGAAFGVLLGVVGALTGASVALYAEWFRVRGVQPVMQRVEVPVEVTVEKEIEKPVEIEVPVTKFTYVPVPVGENVQGALDAILEALPEEAANELKTQLAASQKDTDSEEISYAHAA
uniref:hypothetical protein n=1 Tax=Ruegeria arenilitoris TaxID=1173585 RepID=UPI00147CB9C9|nr:hypothetical protein [Ruegeria arenilitoris]